MEIIISSKVMKQVLSRHTHLATKNCFRLATFIEVQLEIPKFKTFFDFQEVTNTRLI